LPKPNLIWRTEVRPADAEIVRLLCQSAGNFNEAEVVVAVELVQERLAKGPASGYDFLFADIEQVSAGYTCFGTIAGTRDGWDLYWIVVAEEFRGQGLGRQLILETERLIRAAGGRRVYVDTSSRKDYREARKFYQAGGYAREAVIHDFYAPGDHKVLYVKNLEVGLELSLPGRGKVPGPDQNTFKPPYSNLRNFA